MLFQKMCDLMDFILEAVTVKLNDCEGWLNCLAHFFDMTDWWIAMVLEMMRLWGSSRLLRGFVQVRT